MEVTRGSVNSLMSALSILIVRLVLHNAYPECVALCLCAEIGCSSETHCCAVGEADSDSHQPGVRVYCTYDGQNWDRVLYMDDKQHTLSALSLQFLDDQHIFVGGGSLRQDMILGVFWESTNGGRNWTVSTVKDAYTNEMTFGAPTKGLATCFDLEGASCLLEYS